MKKETNKLNSHVTKPESTQDLEVFALLSEQLDTLPAEPTRIASLEQRLANRIQQSIAKHADLITVRARDGIWHKLTAGIRYKPLWQSSFGNSVLVEFAAGAALPVHRHNHLEEGIVLSGSLQVDDLVLQQFDYHISPPGSHHGKIWSLDGGVAFLRGSSVGETFSMMKEVLGGLLPKNHLHSTSVKTTDNEWVEIAPGVAKKVMWDDGKFVSQFIRLAAEASIKAHDHSEDEECIMLSGEAFLGDILLQAGDYQVAAKGSQHLDIYTDVGALFYVRGAVG